MCRRVAVFELAAQIPGIWQVQMRVCDLVMSRLFNRQREIVMYQALYRKYRPQTFDDMVGQLAVTQTLKTQLTSGKMSHAYLFTGSRGTGKTSCAKILAKAVNCLNPENGNPCNRCTACRAIDAGSCMDVLEIDAASNNGVDNVRDLRDEAIYSPSQVNKRVYIIDEVHMLSVAAFNALLKIVEEPPEHLLFILATTELHKIPATILSRCQRFSFRRISQEDIAARLQYVAYQENIDLDSAAARVLARLADGALRDGLSLLDQCASAATGEVTEDTVYQCLGIAGERRCAELMGYIANHDSRHALELFNNLYADGKDIAAMLDELSCMIRDIMVLKTAPGAGVAMLSGVASDQETAACAARFSTGELVRMMGIVQKTLAGFTRSESRRMDAELCIMNLCQPELALDVESINARLTRLEDQIKSGSISFAPAPHQAEEKPVEQQPLPVQPPSEEQTAATAEALEPGAWTELLAAIKAELKPPASGFFAPSANSPLRGCLTGDRLELGCQNRFVAETVDRPEILEVVSRKASAMFGRRIGVKVVDLSSRPDSNPKLEQLLDFGRAHSDIIKIKN